MSETPTLATPGARRAPLPVVPAEIAALAAILREADEAAGRDAASLELEDLHPDALTRLAEAAPVLGRLAEEMARGRLRG